MRKYTIHIILWALWILILLGVYLFWYIQSGVRFIPPHYHANFAVYINWERIDFSDDRYMEDVAGCSITGKILPKDRVHLHENNQDIIHIHDDAVSWGHFFTNIGIVFGESFIATEDEEIYVNSESRKLSFILNDEQVENPFNLSINSEDRLLVVYWEETPQELQELFVSVSDNAWEFNGKYDPGSCGGTNENGISVLVRDRLMEIFWTHNH